MQKLTALWLTVQSFVIGLAKQFYQIWIGLFKQEAKDAYEQIAEHIEARVRELAADITDDAKRDAFIDSLQTKIVDQWNEFEAQLKEASHTTADAAEAHFNEWTAKVAELHLKEKVKKTVKKAKEDVKAFIEKIDGEDDPK